MRNTGIAIAIAVAALLCAGCGAFRISEIIPGARGSGGEEQSLVPPGAKAYACDGGKRLYVRYADDGKSAMVILPEREFRVDRVAAGPGVRYSNGRAVLATTDADASLEEGGTVLYANCKPAPKS